MTYSWSCPSLWATASVTASDREWRFAHCDLALSRLAKEGSCIGEHAYYQKMVEWVFVFGSLLPVRF